MKNHDGNTIWLVRDARGLSANEKVFLFVVASRGTLKTAREKSLKDMGFKKDTFYKVVKSLTEKNIIQAHQGKYNPESGKRDHTYYTINDSVLQNHVPDETDDSVTQNEDSVSQNEDSVEPDNKVTGKVTGKVTQEIKTKGETGTQSLPLDSKTPDSLCVSKDDRSSLEKNNVASQMIKECREKKEKELDLLTRKADSLLGDNDRARVLFDDATFCPGIDVIERAFKAIWQTEPVPA